MPSKNELCPQCGAILKGLVCMKCGYDSAAIAELSDPDVVIEENESINIKPVPEKIEAHEQVRSIFAEIAAASGSEVVAPVKAPKKKFVTPLILSTFVFAMIGLSYWRFIYFTPDYVSPLGVTAADLKAVRGAVEGTESAKESDNEKTIDLDSGLEQGNFDSGNFAQFGPPDTKVMVQAFNIKKIFEKFRKEDILKEIQTDYKISDDDIDVYFSKGVAYFVPGDNLDKWGFVIGVNDKEYVEKRLEDFKKNKENAKYKYASYSAEFVEVTGNGQIMEGTPSEEESDDKDKDSKKEDAESTSEEKGNMYLLISNSNEYLDQMREASEGNLTNLAKEALFAKSRIDLPKVGEVIVYKSEDASVWEELVDIAASKYDYVGLDKILKTVKSVGSAYYSVDSKLRIALSQE